MGTIANMFNAGSGNGYNAGAASGVPNGNQLNAAYNNTNSGIAQQQAFVNALQNQAGQFQGGLGNQQSVFNQQQGLANQLQGVANGTGPNPAQAMLSQATGQNVANQAALMAGQRGAGSNAGLIARQAAQQGAATQQQAVGQGATMQANQSLNALGALGSQQANMANLAGTQVGQQLAQQGQQQGALTSYNQAALSNPAFAFQQQANQIQGQIANTNAGQQDSAIGNLGGSLLKGVGSLVGLAEGGAVDDQQPTMHQAPMNPVSTSGGGPASIIGQFFNAQPVAKMADGGTLATMMANGGKVPAMVSPGERYLSPKAVKEVKEGKKTPIKAGEKIPGKPKVGGAVNSYENDTKPKTLEEGGIVLPRSVTQAKNPGKEAAKFVSAILAKQGLKK